MPPKKRAGKSSKKPTSKVKDPAVIAEKARQTLVSQAQTKNLLTSSSKILGTKSPCALPNVLSRSDGSDILKKNARRNKKYLLIFPGHFSPSPGSQIGKLRGLDSRTPTLDVVLPHSNDEGVLQFRGALVFPRNTLLTVRSGRGKITIEDVFETLLVFPEWAWIGDPDANPGAVPAPFPIELRKQIDTDPGFAAARIAPVPRPPKIARRSTKTQLLDEDEISLDDDDDDDLIRDAMSVTSSQQPSRVLPQRKERGSIDYSKMFADNEDEDEAEEDVEEEEEEEEENNSEVGDTITARKTIPETRDSASVKRKIDLSDDDVIEIVDKPLPPQSSNRRRKRKSAQPQADDDSNSAYDEKPRKRVTSSSKSGGVNIADSKDNAEFTINLDIDSDVGTQRRSSQRTRKRVEYTKMINSDEDSDGKDSDASIHSDAMDED